MSQLQFARKFYIVFDLEGASASLDRALRILTLTSHVERTPVEGYDFDLPDAADPDPAGTLYALDVTDYVMWALGNKPDFSSAAPGGDADGRISLLFAIPGLDALDGSSFKSREAEMYAKPFLHFE